MAVPVPYPLPLRQDEVLAPPLERDFAELRSISPLVRATFPFGGEGWIALGYKEVKAVLSDSRFSLAEAMRGDHPRIRITEGGPPFPPSFTQLDPPEHTKQRGVLMKHLTVKRVRALRPAIEKIVGEQLDAIERKGPPADFATDFAQDIPVRVLCHLLGVPATERARFLADASPLANSRVVDVEEAARLFASLTEYFGELVARKRAHPTDDLLSALVHDTELGGLWTTEELHGVGVVLLIAGHDATAAILGGILRWLVHQPHTYASLRDEPEMIPKAFEEFVRFLPAGLAGTRSRIAMEDVTIGDVTIAAGEAVLPIVHAANFDESEFAHAGELDLNRSASPHVAFGHGAHSCVGSQLARVEIDVAVRATLQRFERLVAVDPDPEWRQQILLRGPKSIPVTW
ncbi:cytochrome P450 [Pseudonocardia xishanensis]|uniref:Cytochrome P450 n=1 Tax=Pseudonocardia xishanensis TaxID=630995 RepID=A0ABP8S0P9_9PSEU